jgi:hypothetical protein
MNMAQLKINVETKRVVGEVLSQLLNVPLMSGLLLIFFYFILPVGVPNKTTGFILALIFISIIPLCSLFFYIHRPGDTREEVFHRQRVASFFFMLFSYPIGALVLYLAHAPAIYLSMAVIYSLVTVGLIVFNKFLHFKASGHAAGVAGPVVSMVYLFGWIATPLLALLPLVTWARLAAKGHTAWQMVVGASLCLVISIGVLHGFGFPPFMGLITQTP